MSDEEEADQIRAAFEAWWARYGYTPPDDTDEKYVWNAYHVRYGLAWMGFSAGWRASRGGEPGPQVLGATPGRTTMSKDTRTA